MSSATECLFGLCQGNYTLSVLSNGEDPFQLEICTTISQIRIHLSVLSKEEDPLQHAARHPEHLQQAHLSVLSDEENPLQRPFGAATITIPGGFQSSRKNGTAFT